MQEAVPAGVGAMAALLKLPEGKLEEVLAEAAQGEVVTPAGFNSPDQIVISGQSRRRRTRHGTGESRRRETGGRAAGERAVPLPADEARAGAPDDPIWKRRVLPICGSADQQLAGARNPHRRRKRAKVFTSRFRTRCAGRIRSGISPQTASNAGSRPARARCFPGCSGPSWRVPECTSFGEAKDIEKLRARPLTEEPCDSGGPARVVFYGTNGRIGSTIPAGSAGSQAVEN